MASNKRKSPKRKTSSEENAQSTAATKSGAQTNKGRTSLPAPKEMMTRAARVSLIGALGTSATLHNQSVRNLTKAPPNYKERAAKTIRAWCTPKGKESPIFTDDTPLKNLSPDIQALRTDIAESFTSVEAFEEQIFYEQWDKKTPKLVADVYTAIAKSFA